MPPTAPTRQERKQQTREALLAAALDLSETCSFDNLSLRQVTKEVGIVPGGFYRHFRDMDELGLALVESSFGTLRTRLREARADRDRSGDAITGSVEALARLVVEHPAEFRFLVRERTGGTAVVRRAIEAELALIIAELGDDLRGFPHLDRWPDDDRHMLAHLVVTAVVGAVAALTDLPADQPGARRGVVHLVEQQLRLVFVAVPHWRT